MNMHLELLIQRYPALADCARDIEAAIAATVGCYTAGGKLRELADICICVPETETFKVQELHLPVYHCLCAAVEEHFFPE